MLNTFIATGQHILCPNRNLGWQTGINHDGFQILTGACADQQITISFAVDGKLIEISTSTPDDANGSLIAQEKPIRVLEFRIEEAPLALNKLPHDLQRFLDEVWDFDVSERAHYAGMISRWKERHHYVFRWDAKEFWCDKDGKIVSYQRV